MANVIKLKRGTSTPTTSNIADGEVAIDTSAKKLYINDNGTVKEIGDSKADLSGAAFTGDISTTGTLEAKAIRYGDSHVKRISVDYKGEETGGDGVNYLVDDEFQEILTITPNGNSENYSIIGRIMAASGANVHTLDVNIALRSNTLPNLHVSGSYISIITGSTEYLTPRLWLKETTTAAFKLVVEINAQIFGRVTADLEIISRNESDLNNIVVKDTADEASEITDTAASLGYTQTTPTKVYETDDGAFTFTSDITSTGDITATTFVKSGGTSSQYLMADGSVSTGGGGGGSSTLAGLTDVTISSAGNGQVLKYNGSAWINDTDATGSGGGGSTDLLEIMLFT